MGRFPLDSTKFQHAVSAILVKTLCFKRNLLLFYQKIILYIHIYFKYKYWFFFIINLINGNVFIQNINLPILYYENSYFFFSFLNFKSEIMFFWQNVFLDHFYLWNLISRKSLVFICEPLVQRVTIDILSKY